ncbi:MAG: hypothetical protein GX333_04710 [Syntrophomonadaceae bacterium]|nr:hypothetical protein [Syntrophomonadaceae bacterium]
MPDRHIYETPIIKITEFTRGLLERDNIPGLLVNCDENGYYNIGIQINDDEVVKVASVLEDEAMAKIELWKDKVDVIRERYKERLPN